MAIVPLNPKNIASYNASFYEFIGSGYAEGKKFSSSLLVWIDLSIGAGCFSAFSLCFFCLLGQ